MLNRPPRNRSGNGSVHSAHDAVYRRPPSTPAERNRVHATTISGRITPGGTNRGVHPYQEPVQQRRHLNDVGMSWRTREKPRQPISPGQFNPGSALAADQLHRLGIGVTQASALNPSVLADPTGQLAALQQAYVHQVSPLQSQSHQVHKFTLNVKTVFKWCPNKNSLIHVLIRTVHTSVSFKF